MKFKMYGKYKYDLYNEWYADEDGNTLTIDCKNKCWSATFSKDGTVLEASSFEELDIKIEDFIYAQKSNKEKIETFHKPPTITKDVCKNAVQLAEKLEETKEEKIDKKSLK